MDLVVRSKVDAPSLYRSRRYWEGEFRQSGVWPAYLAFDDVYAGLSDAIDDLFPEFQLTACRADNVESVVGVAHAVPLLIEPGVELPDQGWDWALATAVEQQRAGLSPNTLCTLSITAIGQFRGLGVGMRLIDGFKTIATDAGLNDIIAPVRPPSKAQVPNISMAEFIERRRPDGRHEDFWVRAHERAGSSIVGVCNESMTAVVPVALWERWANRRFDRSGSFLVEGCLAPISIDLEGGVGVYKEPNIWMKCRLSSGQIAH